MAEVLIVLSIITLCVVVYVTVVNSKRIYRLEIEERNALFKGSTEVPGDTIIDAIANCERGIKDLEKNKASRNIELEKLNREVTRLKIVLNQNGINPLEYDLEPSETVRTSQEAMDLLRNDEYAKALKKQEERNSEVTETLPTFPDEPFDLEKFFKKEEEKGY